MPPIAVNRAQSLSEHRPHYARNRSAGHAQFMETTLKKFAKEA
jgi:hypothetical protein